MYFLMIKRLKLDKMLYFHIIIWCGVGLAQVGELWKILGSIPTRFTLLSRVFLTQTSAIHAFFD